MSAKFASKHVTHFDVQNGFNSARLRHRLLSLASLRLSSFFALTARRQISENLVGAHLHVI